MLIFIRAPLAAAFVLLAALGFLSGCDDSGEDNSSDPLANADVVHCDMPKDQACLEYQRVRDGNTVAFVALDEARAVCASGWLRDSTRPGTFAEGPCSTEAALARCSVSRGYLELDYFYEGFADTETLEDPLAPLTTLCGKSSGTLEKPPF